MSRKLDRVSPDQAKARKKLGVLTAEEAHQKLQKHYKEIKEVLGKFGTAINQGTDQDVYDISKQLREMLTEEKIDTFVRAAW